MLNPSLFTSTFLNRLPRHQLSTSPLPSPSKQSSSAAVQWRKRFLPWQLHQNVAQSWEECRRHAEHIRAIRSRFAPAPGSRPPAPNSALPAPGSALPALNFPPPMPSKPPSLDLLGQPIPTDSFGSELPAQG